MWAGGRDFNFQDLQRFICTWSLTGDKKLKNFDHGFLNFSSSAVGLHFTLAALFMVISRHLNLVRGREMGG